MIINCSFDRLVHILALGQRGARWPKQILNPRFQLKVETGFGCGQLCALLHNQEFLGAQADGDFVARIHLEEGNVNFPAVDGDMAVANHLGSRTARDGESEAECHVIQAALELLDQHSPVSMRRG